MTNAELFAIMFNGLCNNIDYAMRQGLTVEAAYDFAIKQSCAGSKVVAAVRAKYGLN